eukprot:TRINITY_DN29614_c0_g1_i1.p1 TRINITY_DN29614_c0_g1~~TRINITY_DN29614_c0_g1_i1.p1  ORF type:complete len:996 (+),score=165.82 TRINITY_DN29614_c0_g1_i1:147-2990(+)
MLLVVIELAVIAGVPAGLSTKPTRGVVGVPAALLNKVVASGRRPVLVRIAQPLPPRHGDELLQRAHGEWGAFARRTAELGSATDLLVAEVVFDWSPEASAALKWLRLPKQLPAFRLFVPQASGGQAAMYRFSGTISAANLAAFAREKGVWFGRQGCTKELDALAAAYTAAGAAERSLMLAEAERLAEAATADPDSAQYYVKVMRKITAHGPQVATEDVQRLQRLKADPTIPDAVRMRFDRKLNVLASFAVAAARGYHSSPSAQPRQRKRASRKAEEGAPDSAEQQHRQQPGSGAPEGSPRGTAAGQLSAAANATAAGEAEGQVRVWALWGAAGSWTVGGVYGQCAVAALVVAAVAAVRSRPRGRPTRPARKPPAAVPAAAAAGPARAARAQPRTEAPAVRLPAKQGKRAARDQPLPRPAPVKPKASERVAPARNEPAPAPTTPEPPAAPSQPAPASPAISASAAGALAAAAASVSVARAPRSRPQVQPHGQPQGPHRSRDESRAAAAAAALVHIAVGSTRRDPAVRRRKGEAAAAAVAAAAAAAAAAAPGSVDRQPPRERPRPAPKLQPPPVPQVAPAAARGGAPRQQPRKAQQQQRASEEPRQQRERPPLPQQEPPRQQEADGLRAPAAAPPASAPAPAAAGAASSAAPAAAAAPDSPPREPTEPATAAPAQRGSTPPWRRPPAGPAMGHWLRRGQPQPQSAGGPPPGAGGPPLWQPAAGGPAPPAAPPPHAPPGAPPGAPPASGAAEDPAPAAGPPAPGSAKSLLWVHVDGSPVPLLTLRANWAKHKVLRVQQMVEQQLRLPVAMQCAVLRWDGTPLPPELGLGEAGLGCGGQLWVYSQPHPLPAPAPAPAPEPEPKQVLSIFSTQSGEHPALTLRSAWGRLRVPRLQEQISKHLGIPEERQHIITETGVSLGSAPGLQGGYLRDYGLAGGGRVWVYDIAVPAGC